MSATTRKKLPVYQSDEEAEVFVAEANLSEYDLRGPADERSVPGAGLGDEAPAWSAEA